MSVKVMAAVWACAALDDSTLVSVMLVLANSADDDGSNTFPGLQKLTRRTRFTKRTVIRALERLKDEGWIAEEQRGNGRPPAGLRAPEKASYMSQYRIDMQKLADGEFAKPEKRARGGVKRQERVTQSHPFAVVKRVTLTTGKGDTEARKGDFDDKPPHPHKGGHVLETSLRRPPAAPAGSEREAPLTAEQQLHVEQVRRDAVKGAVSAGEWEAYYRDVNRAGAEQAAQSAAAARERTVRLERLKTEMPNLEKARCWLMDACGWADRRGRSEVGNLAEQILGDELGKGKPLWETAPAMAAMWNRYVEAGDAIWPRFGAMKFLELGLWRSDKGWHWRKAAGGRTG